MMTVVTGLVGASILLAFLGILVWWIKDLPFTVIVVGAVLLMLYDLVRTIRHGDGGPRG